MTNLLKAIYEIAKLESFELEEIYQGKNRINNAGDALEYFVKDAFCGSFSVSGLPAKDSAHEEHIAYAGNQNNPPDFILKGGDAVEVKKVGARSTALQLNSSYPKSKLHSDDSRITPDCRDSDGGKWKEKEIIYSVGHLDGGTIRSLWFVYGSCYAADRNVYEKTLKKISKAVSAAPDVEFVEETNELAGVRKVDPLGITFLRVRGMWIIETPQKVFQYILPENTDAARFSLHALIPMDVFSRIPKTDIAKLRKLKGANLRAVQVKSPNNTAKRLEAMLVSYAKA